MNIEPYVNASAVARFLSITRRQVLELARAGKLPAHPLMGQRRKLWRFKLSEVDAAASGNRQLHRLEDAALACKTPESTILDGSPRSQRRKSNG